MRTTIVVPHYGEPRAAEHLVDQLLPQLDDAELVVVDDASPTAYPDEAPPPGVRVVRRERNGGFGSAVNTGARLATGELLLVLNSDLDVGATFVADLLTAYAAHADGGVAAPAVLGPAGTPSSTGRHWLSPVGQALSWTRPLGRLVGSPRYLHVLGIDARARPGRTVDVDWLSGAVLLVPTEIFRAVGGFDESYYMYGEELDLQRRLAERGVRRTYLGSVVVRHEGGGSTDADHARSWLVGSIRRYLVRWGGHRRLQVLLTASSVVNLGWNAGRRLAGQPVRPGRELREELDLIWSPRHLRDPRSRR